MLKIEWHNLKEDPTNLPEEHHAVWLDTIYGIFRGRRFRDDHGQISFHVEGPVRMESIKFENIIAWHDSYELSFIQPKRNEYEKD